MRKKTYCEITNYLQYVYPKAERCCGYIDYDGDRMNYKKAVEMIDNGDFELNILIEK